MITKDEVLKKMEEGWRLYGSWFGAYMLDSEEEQTCDVNTNSFRSLIKNKLVVRVKGTREFIPMNTFLCHHCKKQLVEIVADVPPYAERYWICPDCDSTYGIDIYPICVI